MLKVLYLISVEGYWTEDINRCIKIISSKVDSDANIIFGTVIGSFTYDKVIVTLLLLIKVDMVRDITDK